MESNGDAYLPYIPVMPAEWSIDQVAPDPLANILPEESDASQDVPGQQQPDQQMNSTELGSVEKAVEQCQLANAQLPSFQEEHPPPPPPPPPPPQPSDEPLEPNTEPESEHGVEANIQDGSQGIHISLSLFLICRMIMTNHMANIIVV